MHIPSFAQPYWQAYQATGQLSGPTDRLELDREPAQQALTSLKDEFRHWQSLDETDADLMKGQPGAVRVSGGLMSTDYQEATFEGDTQRGQIVVLNHSPNSHYGFVTLSSSRFTPQAAENFSLQGSVAGDTLLGPELTHIDREMSSDGPVSLVGGPVSVTLTDKAQRGYILSRA
jgi:hypothetical protein